MAKRIKVKGVVRKEISPEQLAMALYVMGKRQVAERRAREAEAKQARREVTR